MKNPVAAIVYDFDKTLCTKNMQEYTFIPALEMSSSDFWKEVNELIDEQEMDSTLAYMFKMVEKAEEHKVSVTRRGFNEMGAKVEFFDGVPTWFERINSFGTSLGIDVEHYIVSSGIKEIVEGTEIAKQFKKIYACEFMYDENGSIRWPKFAVNYTAKTQFLFRINKGVLTVDSNSAEKLNRFTPSDERRIPFSNMIYIGDGLTDVPCMKLVKANGGQSIAVYDQSCGRYAAHELMEADRVNFTAPADYSEGSRIEVIVKSIINMIRAAEDLRTYQ